MDTIVEIFKALSDQNRYLIVTLLIFRELCICDIESLLKMKQANVSKHMMKLKKLNIVDSRKEAQWVYYRMNQSFVEKHKHLIDCLKENALNNDLLKPIIFKIHETNNCQIK